MKVVNGQVKKHHSKEIPTIQHGMGEEWTAFLKRMVEDYPELLVVMNNPNGSIYLTEGVYDIAIKMDMM